MKTNLSVSERADAPTPKFFKRLRTIGLILAAVGATILASPVALPALAVQIGGYLTLAGSVVTAVSQVTVDEGEVQIQEEIRASAKERLQAKQAP